MIPSTPPSVVATKMVSLPKRILLILGLALLIFTLKSLKSLNPIMEAQSDRMEQNEHDLSVSVKEINLRPYVDLENDDLENFNSYNTYSPIARKVVALKHKIRSEKLADYLIYSCSKCASRVKSLNSQKVAQGYYDKFLPKFITIGVHKGGTTSLFGYFSKHAEIKMSCCKETNFFSQDENYIKGKEYYLKHFLSGISPKGLADRKESSIYTTGEGTPNYIRNPVVPKRIRSMLGKNIKLIATLRDSVDRFVSHYVGLTENKEFPKTCNEFVDLSLYQLERCVYSTGQRDDHYENIFNNLFYSIDETKAILSENEHLVVGVFPISYILPRDDEMWTLNPNEKFTCLLKDESLCMMHRCMFLNPDNPISRSVYVTQLERYLLHYDPTSLKVISAKALFSSTKAVMQDLASFIGIRNFTETEMQSFQTIFIGSKHEKNPLFETCDKSRLKQLFDPYDQQLNTLLPLTKE